MCLTAPKRIKNIIHNKAITSNGETLDSSLTKVKAGDWVLAQNNLIIAKITNRDAKKIINLTQNL